MCGIFGIAARASAQLSYPTVTSTLSALYLLSEQRGKESAGIHAYFPASPAQAEGMAWTMKAARRASELLKSPEFMKFSTGPLREAFVSDETRPTRPVAIMAHSRLVTNGTAELNANNQPVRSGTVTMVHNGIVVNVDELWAANPQLKRTAEVDTEVVAALLGDAMSRGLGPVGATAQVFGKIRGAASVAWVRDNAPWIVLATNTGDLYYATNSKSGYTLFASERFILAQTIEKSGLSDGIGEITWLAAGRGVLVDTATNEVHEFRLSDPERNFDVPATTPNGASRHVDLSGADPRPQPAINTSADERLLKYGEKRVSELRRCSKCVLPETFPFIAFDAAGVCNYCRSYKPRYAKFDPIESKRTFIKSLEHYRSNNGEPDTLVAFSGGRDSSYGLHLIKKEFGLSPVTFTYDWGMVTDLARRNVARICGQLGVQNILVSADIKMKRDNVRKNVAAWLKKPDLGMVPLFMAGDKQFFKVVNQLKRQTGIKLDLWCANPLENTDFKSGFCGVSPDFDKARVDYLSLGRKVKMAGYYGSRFVQNPSYLNRSLLDTGEAFMSYYFEPRRDFFFIFDHFIWNEDEVNKTLLGEYDWELAPDTKSTWRIGDGTAPFYNYIYMMARGFSEFDTFRSNQIREGMISREFALKSILVENRPRAQSMRWYLDTIGLDFNATVRRINELDTMGLHA